MRVVREVDDTMVVWASTLTWGRNFGACSTITKHPEYGEAHFRDPYMLQRELGDDSQVLNVSAINSEGIAWWVLAQTNPSAFRCS